jgi:REP element-mobilizing transposase RayT
MGDDGYAITGVSQPHFTIPTNPTRRIAHLQPVRGSLARLINQFKATTTRLINTRRGTPGTPVWQRGYHDRIVRDDIELAIVRRYIRDNPKNW